MDLKIAYISFINLENSKYIKGNFKDLYFTNATSLLHYI